MAKQHLKLVKECQSRDFDGLIAHTTIVMMRYNFLSFYQRQNIDYRSYGDIFRHCCQEMENLNFIDALQRILALAKSAIREARMLTEKSILALIDIVMGVAIRFFNLGAAVLA